MQCDRENSWSCWAYTVDHHGVTDSSALIVSLYPEHAIVSTRKQFTRSFKNQVDFTDNIVAEEAHKEDCCTNVFAEGLRKSCIDTLSP